MWYPEDNYRQDKDEDGGYFLKQDGVVYEGSEDDDFMIIGAGFPVCSFPCEETVIPMLSTGLKDKDGKEIWEGDMAKYTIQRQEWPHICEVVVKEGYYSLASLDDNMSDYLWEYNPMLEVIGNKYENPELVKGE